MTNYWFGSRVKGGSAIAEGPYKTHEEVSRHREMAKAPDVEVSIWFVAKTKEEAQEKAEFNLR